MTATYMSVTDTTTVLVARSWLELSLAGLCVIHQTRGTPWPNDWVCYCAECKAEHIGELNRRYRRWHGHGPPHGAEEE
jgi:hypothetical protein